MKSNSLVKFFAVTALASVVLFPLGAKSQSISANSPYTTETTKEYSNIKNPENQQLSKITHNDKLILASIDQGDVENGWADYYGNQAEVEEGWVDYHTERGEMEEALERQRAATEARQQEQERRQAAMEKYQSN